MDAGNAGSGLRALANAAWRAGLDRIDDSGAWSAREVDRMVANGLSVGGGPLVRVARPNFVEPGQLVDDQRVVSAATECIVAASELALASPELGSRCFGAWLDGPQREVFDLPQDYGHRLVFGRFDGARADGGMQILEFNGGLPGGVMGSDSAASVMRGWPPYAEVAEQFDLQIPDLGGRAVAALVGAWHGFGGAGTPNVVFAVPQELRAYTAVQLRYLAGRCAEAGVAARAADPGELAHGSSGLTLSGWRVDLVVRVFFTSMLAGLGSRLDALTAATRAGDAVVVTSYRSGLYGHKAVFALVTDPAVELDVPAASLELARAHLPWTRILGPGRTTAVDGSVVDLLAYAEAAQDHLVLKPSDGTGGAGVLLGWDCPAEQWRAALATAAEKGVWVVQDRIPLLREYVPWLGEGFPESECIVDHNPVINNDEIAGYFARISPVGGVTNLSAGGASAAPTFVVRRHPPNSRGSSD